MGMCHCEELSDEAIPCKVFYSWDCFVAKAPRNDSNVSIYFCVNHTIQLIITQLII
ncbi:MAG: hypothetical protein FWC80_02970 [Firmicutes bacterium]|nr:hypothetical protein [Bacillota bacterium]